MKKLDRLWQPIIYGVRLILKNPALLKVVLKIADEIFRFLERHEHK